MSAGAVAAVTIAVNWMPRVLPLCATTTVHATNAMPASAASTDRLQAAAGARTQRSPRRRNSEVARAVEGNGNTTATNGFGAVVCVEAPRAACIVYAQRRPLNQTHSGA